MRESWARRPSRFGSVLAIAVASIALVASMSGFAGARSPDAKDEMRLLTVATGSLEVVADGEQVPIPMQNQAFTQEAGSGIMFITTVSTDIPGFGGNDCSGTVAWNTLGDTMFPDTSFLNLGQWWGRQTFFLPSVAADTSYPTMGVGTNTSVECPYGEGGSPATFTVDVEVEVWAFR